MKLIIASDIHGSVYYCEKLISAFHNEKADKLLLLGDILYHGPRNALPENYNPQNVANLLNSIKNEIFCVKGNCDAEVDQMLLEFPIMSEYSLLCIDKLTLYLSHGHKYNQNSFMLNPQADILLCGHNHIPDYKIYNDFVYVNPGSVSIPKNNSSNSYIVFDNNIFSWKDFNNNTFLTLHI